MSNMCLMKSILVLAVAVTMLTITSCRPETPTCVETESECSRICNFAGGYSIYFDDSGTPCGDTYCADDEQCCDCND